jgi:hypothetical protein
MYKFMFASSMADIFLVLLWAILDFIVYICDIFKSKTHASSLSYFSPFAVYY